MVSRKKHSKRLNEYFLAALLCLALVGACDRVDRATDSGHLEQAKSFEAKGDYLAAIVESKNALQKNPQNLDARLFLGNLYVKLGQGKDAEPVLKQAQEQGADEQAIAVPMGQALFLQGDFKRVLAEVAPSPSLTAANLARIHAIRGEAQLALGRFADAAASYQRALAAEPDLAEALVGQARLAMSARNYDKAAALLQQVLDKSPTNAGALLGRADLARLMGKPDEAIAAFQKVLDLYPYHLAAHFSLASLYVQAGKFDEASKHVEVVRTTPGATVMANYLQAMVEFGKQNYAAARQPIQKVLAVAPEHLPTLLLAGATEYSLGSNELAEKYLRQALGLAPNAMIARKLLAATLLKTGQVPQAIETLQLAVKQSPDDAALMRMAGDAQMRARNFTAASEYFAKAVALDPKNANTKTLLGVSRLAEGDTDRAMADLEAVIASNPLDYKADLVVIVAHMSRNEYDQAMKAIDVLEKKQPANPTTFNFRGGVLMAKNDLAGARSAFEKSLALDPTYVPAAINLARLDLNEKKPDAAKKRFAVILEKDPRNVEALLALADLARVTSAPAAEYLSALDRAAEADPKAVKPLVLISQNSVRSDPKRALLAARKAFALTPNEPEVLDALGMAQVALGENSGAQSAYSKLVVLQPNSPVAHFRLASVLVHNGNQASAKRSLQRALELKPDYLEAQAELIGLELNAGNSAEALKLSRKVQLSVPESPVGYVLEGDAFMVAKAYSKAASSYEKAFSIARNGPIVVKIHSAYSAAGKRAIADTRVQDWLKETPDDIGARYYLASSAQVNRQYALAIEQYGYILRKRPEDPVVLNDLAWVYAQVKDPRALATAEHAFKLRPGEAPIADTLGWILVEQGSTQRGLQILREATNKAPDSVDIRMHLIQALLKIGEKDQARSELERIVNLRGSFPQKSEAERMLLQLQPEG